MLKAMPLISLMRNSRTPFVQPPFAVVKILVISGEHLPNERRVIIIRYRQNLGTVDNLIVPNTQICQADKPGTAYTNVFLQRIVKNQKLGTVIFDFDFFDIAVRPRNTFEIHFFYLVFTVKILYHIFIKISIEQQFSLDFAFLCDILCADKAERSHTMTTEEKIKGLEHLLRKCPDVITALQASRLIHVSKNAIHAAINEGKLIAYAYRGKRMISKADFIDYLAATTDDETAWQRRQRERMSHDE